MGELTQFILLGLGTGALYAIGAQGIVLIYRGSGVINFSHGAMALLGAAVFAECRDTQGLPLLLSLLLALSLTGLIGYFIDFAIMRRLNGASPLGRLVVTLGVLGILESLVIVRYGSGLRFVDSFLPNHSITVNDSLYIGADRLWIFAIACVITGLLWLIYRYSDFGRQTTAVAENPRSAAAMGVSPHKVSAINWFLGATLAALAGILLAPVTGLMPATMVLLINPLLAAALVGGFSSFPLTLAGGLLIGALQGLIGAYDTGTGWSASVPFLIIIVTMIVQGRALPLRGYLNDKLPTIGNPGKPGLGTLVFLFLAVALIYIAPEDWINGITGSLLAATVLLSIIVVTGFAGQVSLAQYTMAGVGAFISARLAAVYGLPFPLVFLLALVVTVPLGMLFALPALRTRGINLAIVTLGLGLAADNLIFKNIDYTGGFAGTQVRTPSFFGISFDAIMHPERYALLTLLLFTVSALMITNMRRGITGRRLLATRANERAAQALGVSVVGAKIYAFSLAAAIAAAGGALGAFRYPNVRFDVGYSPFESIPAMLMAFLGGIGFIGGALIGGLLSVGGLVNEMLSAFLDLKEWQGLVIGIGAILMVLVHPNGLAEALSLRRKQPVTKPIISNEIPASPNKAQSLTLKNLRVEFGGLVALDDVSLQVNPGEIVGLIGPNGAGKTTLIDSVTGFTPLTSGSLTLGNTDISELSPVKRARYGLGRTFQNLELFDDLTVADNLQVAADPRARKFYLSDLLGPKHPGFSPDLLHTIKAFELEGCLDKYTHELSYGQRRLLGIARAVAAGPSVLLLDEPAAGLDSHETVELGQMILWLAREKNIAILLVEHDMALVMSVCDNIVVLDFGHKLAAGKPKDIAQNQQVISAYLGPGAEGETASD